MSNFTSLKKAIRKDIFGAYTETPKLGGNVPKKESWGEFIKYFVVHGSGEKENISDTDQVHRGAIMVQIFTPIDQGDLRADEIADILKVLLVDKELDNGNLFIHEVKPIPATDPTGRYNQLNIEAPFTFNYRQEV